MTELEGYIRYWVTELKAILQGMSLDALELVLQFFKFLTKQKDKKKTGKGLSCDGPS